jgi:DNA-directed RNA polymerase specialized sigma24 family protein
LDDGLAEQLVQRREELLPELDQKLKHLEDCLDKLPGHHKALVEGYYHRRDGIEQLAAESKRTVAAAYKMLQRVRETLRTCIEDAGRREAIV